MSKKWPADKYRSVIIPIKNEKTTKDKGFKRSFILWMIVIAVILIIGIALGVIIHTQRSGAPAATTTAASTTAAAKTEKKTENKTTKKEVTTEAVTEPETTLPAGTDVNSVADSTASGITLQQSSDGLWYTYRNGYVDRSFTGLVQDGDRVCFVWQGIFDTSYTGVYPNNKGYWYVKNGVVQLDYSGTVTDSQSGVTYQIQDGKALT